MSAIEEWGELSIPQVCGSGGIDVGVRMCLCTYVESFGCMYRQIILINGNAFCVSAEMQKGTIQKLRLFLSL